MKKLLLLFSATMLLSCSNVQAQVTLDTIKPTLFYGQGYDFKTVQISTTETKYFQADSINNTFNLYNMDWSPFMTNIPVPRPFDMMTENYQCLYISRTLFDCDSSNIEFLYASPLGNPDRQVFVVRTDGTQLLQVDSAFCQYCYGACLGGSAMVRPVVSTSDGARLFVMRTTAQANGEVYIYKLCGNLPTETFEFPGGQPSSVRIYPNPATNSLTFAVNPPDNINAYQLVLFDNAGQEIFRQNVTAGQSNVIVDVSSFSNGTYQYRLCTANEAYQSGSFIIAR